MINYRKIQSNGNNFLLLDNMDLMYKSEDLSKLAIRDCDVKKGIGADGILVLEPSKKNDFKMRIINANGFESEMCGNGARCVARYTHEQGMTEAKMSFETLAGEIQAKVNENMVKITMGNYGLNLISNGFKHGIKYHFMELGVPHVVIFQEDNAFYSLEEMRNIGRVFDTDHDTFARGTNVNFVRKLSDGNIDVITYERGVEDITDSCGTGSCASAVLSSKRYEMKSPIEVQNIGGINRVYFTENDHSVEVLLEGKVFYSGYIQCEPLAN
ncbi:diaminopimelate epimerase [Fusibacter bizertensis]